MLYQFVYYFNLFYYGLFLIILFPIPVINIIHLALNSVLSYCGKRNIKWELFNFCTCWYLFYFMVGQKI